MTSQSKNYYYVIALVAILVFGTAIRFHNLGKFSFWTDELLHVLAAESILENGEPIVPMRGPYRRALLYTEITAGSFLLFGVNEVSARLPSLIFNVVLLVLSFFIVRRLFNTQSALIFIFILAFSPIEIQIAREARMYSLFQLLYFLMSTAFIMGLEVDALGERKGARRGAMSRLERFFDIRVWWLVGGLIIFPIAYQVHDLTVNFGATVLAYCAVLIVWNLYRAKSFSVPIKYIGICIAAGLVALTLNYLNPSLVEKILFNANWVPRWANADNTSTFNYYRWYFTNNYPAMTFLFPLASIYVISVYKKVGLFVVLSFVIPMALHVFIAKVALVRYMYYIYPFFLLTASVFLGLVLPSLVGIIKRAILQQSEAVRIVFGVSAAVGLLVFCYPWIANSVHRVNRPYYPDWKSAFQSVALEDNTIITTEPLHIYYHLNKKPEYYFRVGVKSSTSKNGKAKPKRIGMLKEFIDVVEREPEVVFITSSWAMARERIVSKKTRQYIAQNLCRVMHGGDKNVVIYKSGTCDSKGTVSKRANSPELSAKSQKEPSAKS